jgi:alpha-galactosidase
MMNKTSRQILPVILLLAASFGVFAQTVTIPIESEHNALVLQVDDEMSLNMVYYDQRLSGSDQYADIAKTLNSSRDKSRSFSSAYTTAGSRNLLEPAIAVTHADGNNSLDLHYVNHHIDRSAPDITLVSILLKDPAYDIEVTLYYKVYIKEDIYEQWSLIKHRENGNIILHKFASANLYLRGSSFWLKQYYGDWAREMQPEESRLTHGIKVLDSKLGTRANLYQPPVFMISFNKPATENGGSVLYGMLEWSGNFRTDLEVDPLNNLRLISGINNYASDYILKPGATFTTPKFIHILSNSGVGDASRNLHRWARNYQLPDGWGPRLTLLNNWETTAFSFDEIKLKGLIANTKKLGLDLFLLDDGWFGNQFARNSDRSGLGDWQENKAKLPHGLPALIKTAGENQVKFGIWIEPEMVNPESTLYTHHPEWVVKQPNRKPFYYRNQLVLDLSNPEVQNFVFETVDSLFSKNAGLAYIKWDCNSWIYNAYSPFLKNEQSDFFVDYVNGLYSVLKRLRAKYIKIPIMLCSGGGGRVDYGALQYFTEYWPSDNTDPLERIFIQWENSFFYPAIASANHVTDWGKQPLKYRTDVAMMGKLGFDIVVDKLNDSELSFCQSAVKVYREFTEPILHGDQYRLQDPYSNDFAALMYVDPFKKKAILFNYLVNNRFGSLSRSPVPLKGLNAFAHYRVSEINLYPGKLSTFTAAVYTGDFLMRIGVNPDINNTRTSVVLAIEQIDQTIK